MEDTNPLSKYFRVPGMHVTLPSNGAFNDPDDFEVSMNGEFAILPMTASDEMHAKNPDGLLNGFSIEKIIKSCVPGIKNPRDMPSADIDYLLLAIKKCTYGPSMTLEIKCPKCGSEHKFSCNIDEILDKVVPFEPSYEVRLNDDMVASLRPYDYKSTTKINLAAFEEARLFRGLTDVELSEELRVQVFSDSFEKISSINLDLMASCVISISTPDGTVSDQTFIKEFIKNARKEMIDLIREKIFEMSLCGLNKNIDVECPKEECGHKWTTELVFDPSHFFE